MITAEQLRGARAILRLEQTALAEKANVSVETIKRLERQNGPLQANFDTIRRLKEALELAGVEFDDSGPGVGLAADRVTALAEQMERHLVAAVAAAQALDELMAQDPQLRVPQKVASLIDVLISNVKITRFRRR